MSGVTSCPPPTIVLIGSRFKGIASLVRRSVGACSMPPVGATFIWLTTLMTVGGVMTRGGQIGLGMTPMWLGPIPISMSLLQSLLLRQSPWVSCSQLSLKMRTSVKPFKVRKSLRPSLQKLERPPPPFVVIVALVKRKVKANPVVVQKAQVVGSATAIVTSLPTVLTSFTLAKENHDRSSACRWRVILVLGTMMQWPSMAIQKRRRVLILLMMCFGPPT